MTDYTSHIETALEKAEEANSKISNDILALDGMTGAKTRHFYNNLLDISGARYLEIGTWKGSSVCSAMFNNESKVICIDNWTQFGGPRSEFLANFEKFRGKNDARFIESDCWSVPLDSIGKFNIFLFDGDHTEYSHFKALLHYTPVMDDIFIYIVDDWNWDMVRIGTNRAIETIGLKILYEKEIRTSWDNTVPTKEECAKGWWNGLYIAVLQKPSL